MEQAEINRPQGGLAAAHAPRAILTRRERLERWAILLERSDPDERLSPVEIAHRDPLLRSQGLDRASLAEAAMFFGLDIAVTRRLSEHAPGAGTQLAARRLRKFAARNDRTMLAAGVAAAGVVCVPLLAYLFA